MTGSTGPDGRRIGAVVAALLLAAMVAIALLGLLPHASKAAGSKAAGSKAAGSRAAAGRAARVSNGRTAAGRASNGRTASAAGGHTARTAAEHAGAGRSAHAPTRAQVVKPLQGKVVGIDPGHNGRSWTDPSYINHPIWNGREWEACDTTGTETDGGYTEALFNWNVARYLASDLRAEGARVVLTRHNNDGIGPCVTQRAATFRRAKVAVAVAIHGDGGPANGRGFAVLGPVKDGINNAAIEPSWRFDRILATSFRSVTGMPYSTYDGRNGLKARDNLAGENLARYPYALIECGNMRNATDARLMVQPAWQRRAAKAIAAAITNFLTNRP